MATTGKINGTDLLVFVGGTAITHSDSCSISFSMGTRPASTKDSGGWRELLEAGREWSVSCDAMVALDATYGIEELWGIINSRTSVTVKFATSDATDRFFSGTAWLTAVDITAGQEDTATFTASFDGTAKLSFAIT